MEKLLICDPRAGYGRLPVYTNDHVELLDPVTLVPLFKLPFSPKVTLTLQHQAAVFPACIHAAGRSYAAISNVVYELHGTRVSEVCRIPETTDEGYGRACGLGDELLLTNERGFFVYNPRTCELRPYEMSAIRDIAEEAQEIGLFNCGKEAFVAVQVGQKLVIREIQKETELVSQCGQLLAYQNGIVLFDDFWGKQYYWLDLTRSPREVHPINLGEVQFDKVDELQRMSRFGVILDIFQFVQEGAKYKEEYLERLERLQREIPCNTAVELDEFGRSQDFVRLFIGDGPDAFGMESETARVLEIAAVDEFELKTL